MPDVGKRTQKKKVGGLEFCKITNDSHWEIFVSLLVRDGVSFLWQNVDLNKIAIAIAYKHFFFIFSYINRFQKLKPPYWVIAQSQF
jgi:hypothetical protein